MTFPECVSEKTKDEGAMLSSTSVGVMCLQLKAFALSPSGQRLESPTTIEIYVLDQNDNRPNFTKPKFEGSVPEFAAPGRVSFNFNKQSQVNSTQLNTNSTQNLLVHALSLDLNVLQALFILPIFPEMLYMISKQRVF